MFENKDYIIFFEDLKLLNIIKHNYSYDLKQKKWFFNFEHISKLIGEKFFESRGGRFRFLYTSGKRFP